MDVLKVSAHSSSIATAGALANTIRQAGSAEIQGIGPKAINQAVKAIAISRSYLASSGLDLIAVPSFVDVDVEGESRTAIRFLVRPRHLLSRTDATGESGRVDDNETQDESGVIASESEAYAVTEVQSDELAKNDEYGEAPREGRFIKDFPENPIESDDFGP